MNESKQYLNDAFKSSIDRLISHCEQSIIAINFVLVGWSVYSDAGVRPPPPPPSTPPKKTLLSSS
ncbi:hypothetical protein DERP_005468 [Dermatophagoides pteronyssinus]|uniref:Uncharacterized protein n=1 Tax=Dermatophagoides pteronyssinus TaxID=6956 RepID=A0ABQ8JMW3_DERPT|nr:hypothetical protein DERP_005468 [Dermatophagoides pteronyssinus]